MPSEVGQELGVREYLQTIGLLYSVNLNSKVMSYDCYLFIIIIRNLNNVISYINLKLFSVI